MSHHSKSKLIRNILEYSGSTGTDRLVHLILAEYSDWANTAMSIPDLARYARISVRQAQRAVKSLLDEGYITRTQGNGRGNVSSYHVNVTPWQVVPIPENGKGDTHKTLSWISPTERVTLRDDEAGRLPA